VNDKNTTSKGDPPRPQRNGTGAGAPELIPSANGKLDLAKAFTWDYRDVMWEGTFSLRWEVTVLSVCRSVGRSLSDSSYRAVH